MKKLILIAAALVFGTGVMAAQDLATATEKYNAAAEALQMGSNNTALKNFEEAIAIAEALGEEGADIFNNCKDVIPQLQLSMAKDLFNNKDFAGALAQVKVAQASAEKYENADVLAEAVSLIPTILMQEGNAAIKAKDYATAAAKYQEIVNIEPTNGSALLRLGQALNATGKTDEAIAAFLSAKDNGEAEDAVKQLSNVYVRKASADLKAKKYQAAIEDALKSNEYLENANAMKIAGTAASQLQKADDAIAYLKKYLELSPKAKDAAQMCYTIGALAQQKGDKATAVEYYEKIVNDPKFGAAVKPLLDALK